MAWGMAQAAMIQSAAFRPDLSLQDQSSAVQTKNYHIINHEPQYLNHLGAKANDSYNICTRRELEFS